ncbi:MAG: hypothetical protein RL885_09565 [Planctomycetota bacterium]
MLKIWSSALLTLLLLAAATYAQDEEKAAEKKDVQESSESDPKAIEFLGKVDKKLYSPKAAGAKDIKCVMSSEMINEQLATYIGDVDLRFIKLWKAEGDKEAFKVEGLPAGMEAMADQLTQGMEQPASMAIGGSLMDKAKKYVVTMEKDGDLTKIQMVAKDPESQTQQETVWYSAEYLPVKTQQTQVNPFGGEMTTTANIKVRKVDDKEDLYVMESIESTSEMGSQEVKLSYKKTANGFWVLEKLAMGGGEEAAESIELNFDVTVNGGIEDSEFSG